MHVAFQMGFSVPMPGLRNRRRTIFALDQTSGTFRNLNNQKPATRVSSKESRRA